MCCVSARIFATRFANPPRLVPALPVTYGIAAAIEQPYRRAASASCSIERAPMPRVGKFTTRTNAVSSFGLSIRRRYASACFTSWRSKNRRPPYTRYGMPDDISVCSIERDCALLRYRTATSLRAIPVLISERISSTIQPASCESVLASYTRTGSPWPASVRRFLPRRCALFEISWFAASRMLPCDR